MKTIIMTHEDGSQIRINRSEAEIEWTINMARQCGYIKFDIIDAS